MTETFAKPEYVLELAGIALADMTILVSAQQYVPTLHLAKTSFWSGTKINQIRFGSYPDTGLMEIARAEASARAGTWDAWAFSCVAVAQSDQKVSLFVEAGDAPPFAKIVRITQEFRPPKDGFRLVGGPLIAAYVLGKDRDLSGAELSSWQGYLSKGINKLKTARENWDKWSASSPGQIGA